MTKTGPDQGFEGFRRLATPAEPQVWRRAWVADHEPRSFFFAWTLTEARVEPFADHDSRLDRHVRAGWRRSAARGSGFNVDSLLAEAKGVGLADGEGDFDEIDDSMLRVSRTKLFDRSRLESDPRRYVDPFATPYLTLSARKAFGETGVRLGDFATAMNPRTGRVLHAILGDDRDVPGVEPSPALSERLDLAPTDWALYLVHPRTGKGQGTIPTDEEVRRQGERLFRALAWSAILTEFWKTLETRE